MSSTEAISRACARASASGPASTSASSANSAARTRSSAPDAIDASRPSRRARTGPLGCVPSAWCRSSRAPAMSPRRPRARARISCRAARSGGAGAMVRPAPASVTASTWAKASIARADAARYDSPARSASPAPSQCRASSLGSASPAFRASASCACRRPRSSRDRASTRTSLTRSWEVAQPCSPRRARPLRDNVPSSSRMSRSDAPDARASARAGTSRPTSARRSNSSRAGGSCSVAREMMLTRCPSRATSRARSSAWGLSGRHRCSLVCVTAFSVASVRSTSVTASGVRSVADARTTVRAGSADSPAMSCKLKGPNSTKVALGRARVTYAEAGPPGTNSSGR